LPGTAYEVQLAAVKDGLLGAWSGGFVTVTEKREPQWSDLVVWDGTNEMDVTRVQMLFFTLIAAFFVILDIVNDRGIPKVPDGIVQLLGLSNGIYVGGRYLGGRITPS